MSCPRSYYILYSPIKFFAELFRMCSYYDVQHHKTFCRSGSFGFLIYCIAPQNSSPNCFACILTILYIPTKTTLLFRMHSYYIVQTHKTLCCFACILTILHKTLHLSVWHAFLKLIQPHKTFGRSVMHAFLKYYTASQNSSVFRMPSYYIPSKHST